MGFTIIACIAVALYSYCVYSSSVCRNGMAVIACLVMALYTYGLVTLGGKAKVTLGGSVRAPKSPPKSRPRKRDFSDLHHRDFSWFCGEGAFGGLANLSCPPSVDPTLLCSMFAVFQQLAIKGDPLLGKLDGPNVWGSSHPHVMIRTFPAGFCPVVGALRPRRSWLVASIATSLLCLAFEGRTLCAGNLAGLAGRPLQPTSRNGTNHFMFRSICRCSLRPC